jgi:ABC-type glutathione transport system ATPase component
MTTGVIRKRPVSALASRDFPGELGTGKGLMGTSLEVRDLSIRYRSAESSERQAVDAVTFNIAPGEVLGVMGESGCGKTSIALAMLGLLPKDRAQISGSIVFGGQNLVAIDERSFRRIRGAKISMVYQEPGIALSPFMSAGDQIAEVAHAHTDWSWKQCRSEARTMLSRVGLSSTDRILSAYPHQLSGGQLQRVVLAQALICRPAVLIADEPTAALDARSQADFVALLRELNHQLNVSILLISHTPEIQASLADRVLVMKDGQIVEQGRFEDLYWNALHPYTKTLLRRNSRAGADAESEHSLQEQLVR